MGILEVHIRDKVVCTERHETEEGMLMEDVQRKMVEIDKKVEK